MTSDMDMTVMTSMDMTVMTSDMDMTVVTSDMDMTVVTSDMDMTVVTSDMDMTVVTSDMDMTVMMSLETDYNHVVVIIICPIAIAYSMGQIVKPVCVCQSVTVSVCGHSHGRIPLSIFP